MGKIFRSYNEVLVHIMYSYIYLLLHKHTLSDVQVSLIMYECFINMKKTGTYLKREMTEMWVLSKTTHLTTAKVISGQDTSVSYTLL